MHQHIIDTPLGWFRLTGDAQLIRSAHWIAEEDAIVGCPGGLLEWKSEAQRQIREYFEGSRDSFALPIAPEGSDFQRSVWDCLMDIPKGTTVSYSDLAIQLGKPHHAQVIGGAVGSNPLLLLLPCHRVIGSDGSLAGYAAGLKHKEWLLEHEGALAAPQLRLF